MPGNINLAALFKMKPKLASEYLEKKVSQKSWTWYEIYEKEHDKIFTVAKTAGYDVLKDIRAAVQKAIDEGTTLRDFQKELKPLLKQKGWWGKVPDPSDPTKEVQLGSVRRLETIYTTNLRTSYQAGRYANLEDNAAFRPYWQYIAVMDDRTRKEHKELHGKVFRHDDPFWENFFPPNGWNCRCTVKSLSQKDLDRLGLTVENSAGKLRDATAELPNGTKVQGKVYRTNGKIIQTDVGWNYNPGRSTYQPQDDGKDPALRAQLEKELREYQEKRLREQQREADPSSRKEPPKWKINIRYKDIFKTIEEAGIKYNEVKPLEKPLTEGEIIRKLSENPKRGACSSLALAYIGNKLGFDVKIRGGISKQVFSETPILVQIAKKANGLIEESYNDIETVAKLLKTTEVGREYFLTTGSHTAIIRKAAKGYEYLDLQDTRFTAWRPIDQGILKRRFGCSQQHKYRARSALFDIENLRNNEDFKKILGYINSDK